MAFSFFGGMFPGASSSSSSVENSGRTSIVGGIFQSPQERAKADQEEAHRLRMLEREQRQQDLIKIEAERLRGQEQKKLMFEKALQEAETVKMTKIKQATIHAQIKEAKFQRVSKKELEYQQMLEARENELHLMANEERLMVQYLIDQEAARIEAIKQAKRLKILEQEALTREKWEADNADSKRRMAILSERAMMGKEEHRCIDAWKYEAHMLQVEAQRRADEAAAIAAKNWSELLVVVKPQGLDRNPDFKKLSDIGLGSIDAIAEADEADLRNTGMSKVIVKRLQGVCKTAVEERLYREAEAEKAVVKSLSPKKSEKDIKSSTPMKSPKKEQSPPPSTPQRRMSLPTGTRSTTPNKNLKSAKSSPKLVISSGSLKNADKGSESKNRSTTPKKNLKSAKSSPKLAKEPTNKKALSFDSKERASHPKTKTSDLSRPKSLTSISKNTRENLGSFLLAHLKADSKKVESLLQDRGIFSIAQLAELTSNEAEEVVEIAKQAKIKPISANRLREAIKKAHTDALSNSSPTPGTAI